MGIRAVFKCRPAKKLPSTFFAIVFAVLSAQTDGAAADTTSGSLLEIFERPPDAARASAFWGWIDGNVAREGITADLESIRDVGMSGAIQFTLGMNIAAGPVNCASNDYFDLVAHTLREVARLNLEMGFHNGPGFSSSSSARWCNPTWKHTEKSREKKQPNYAGSPIPKHTVCSSRWSREAS